MMSSDLLFMALNGSGFQSSCRGLKTLGFYCLDNLELHSLFFICWLWLSVWISGLNQSICFAVASYEGWASYEVLSGGEVPNLSFLPAVWSLTPDEYSRC